MASSIKKMLWASSGYRSRTTADRKAHRAAMKAEQAAYAKSPEGRARQDKINKAHAEWIAAGMPSAETV